MASDNENKSNIKNDPHCSKARVYTKSNSEQLLKSRVPEQS